MRLVLDRIFHDTRCTLGILKVNDRHYATLEDPPQEAKIPGKTRIPAGTYEILYRTVSPMAERYRDRFGEKHLGMLWLQDVPGFEWVYIHVGNTPGDTEGCILVGEALSPLYGTITDSMRAYSEIYEAVREHLTVGEAVTIEIRDQFPG